MLFSRTHFSVADYPVVKVFIGGKNETEHLQKGKRQEGY